MGSERQTNGYIKALAKLGHTIYLVNLLKDSPDWSVNYDICHLINASGLKGVYMLMAQLAREMGIPVLMSPVYWPTDEVQEEILEAGLTPSKEHLTQRFDAHIKGVAKMLYYADHLLPNAEIEMEKVAELMEGSLYRFGPNEINAIKDDATIDYTVIHNGIDVEDEIDLALRDTDLDFHPSFEEVLYDKFVLCVARVEPRKNQLNLIKAVDILCEDDPDLQTVIMGWRSEPYQDYIKEEGCGRNVLYCPPGPPSAVMKMMRRCNVHALPSFIDTPGLVNLEAAALNRPIVVGDRGSVREYFGSMPGVLYCDPKDPENIAEAIKQALDFGEAKELGEFVRNTYSYTQIAYKLEMVYKQAIEQQAVA